MMVEANKIPPIHQRKFEIGLRAGAALLLSVVMSRSVITCLGCWRLVYLQNQINPLRPLPARIQVADAHPSLEVHFTGSRALSRRSFSLSQAREVICQHAIRQEQCIAKSGVCLGALTEFLGQRCGRVFPPTRIAAGIGPVLGLLQRDSCAIPPARLVEAR